jgi:hypothetical protein
MTNPCAPSSDQIYRKDHCQEIKLALNIDVIFLKVARMGSEQEIF